MTKILSSRMMFLLVALLLIAGNALADTTLGSVEISVNTVWPEDTYHLTSLTVSSGATLSIAGGSTLKVSGAVAVTDSSIILLQGKNTTTQVNGTWQGVGVTINAASIQIDAGSRITADGQGYVGASGIDQPGSGPGGPGASTSNFAYGSGGGYGGAGGAGGNGNPAAGGSSYGNSLAPMDLGSGGNYTNGGSGNGGGAIRLAISGTLTNNGTITANGINNNMYRGGGSGGSVYVTTGSLSGVGVFTANGGNGPGGGGGGRIAVYYHTNTSYSGFAGSTASGGVQTISGFHDGQAGTVGFFATSGGDSQLKVYQNFSLPSDTYTHYTDIDVSNGATLALANDTILNTTSIHVSNGSTFAIGGGSIVTLSDTLSVSGNSTVLAQGKNTSAQVNNKWQGVGATINAANIIVEAGSRISADGQGYLGATGPFLPASGPGGAGASIISGAYGSGGGYGGAGGNGYPAVGGSSYGNSMVPLELGSGGNYSFAYGGNGGGAIRLLVTNALTLNGTITSNGSTSIEYSGGGSGGSIFVGTESISGSGLFIANGGNGAINIAGGGSGGRIAVYYKTNNSYSGVAGSTVNGGVGSGGYQNGQPGTVIFSSTPLFTWIKPTGETIHDTARLEWGAGTVDFPTITVDVIASSGGSVYTIGSRLPSIYGMDWDSTSVPKGSYELRLVFRDGTGVVVSEVPKTVLINNSVVWHSGTIAGDQTWSADKAHVIEGNLIIPSGVHVTINPGTVIKVVSGARIIVEAGGIFDALGTVTEPIIITSLYDDSAGGDTNLDGTLTSAFPGIWLGVSIQGNGQFNQNNNTYVRYIIKDRSGTLTANETWLGSQLIHIPGSIYVPIGVTLTIQPGAIIKLGTDAVITVQAGGQLLASGTGALPIYFTSIKDDSVGGDTNGDGNTTTPAFGDWGYIYLISGGTASFNHATIRYGNGGGMITSNGTLTVNNSILSNAVYDGIWSGGGTANITNSIITETNRAINAHGGAVSVTNCTIDNNVYGIWGDGRATVANSIVTNSAVQGIVGVTTVNFSDIWNPQATSGNGNYSGNGNISIDPKYRNLTQKDYRLDYGSPAIDAADGIAAPVTDYMGAPRYDDPRTPNTGIVTPSGAFADMGAYELVEHAASDLDLVAGTVIGPSTAIVGNQAQISWTVTNIGQGFAVGPWHDSVYLVRDPDTNPVEIFAGEVLVGESKILGPGQSINTVATITVPGTIMGNHRWEIRTNSRGEVFEGTSSGNNAALSAGMVAVDLKKLMVDGQSLAGQFTSVGQSSWYKILPDPGKDVGVSLSLSGNTATTQLYIAQGYLPDAQHFDFKQNEWNSGNTSATITDTSAQTYYVTAYAASLSSGTASFSISAKSVNFSVTDVQPGWVSNTGNVTFEITGGQLSFGAIFGLVGPNGTVYSPLSVFAANSSTVYATFNLNGLATGNYGIQVTENGATITGPNTVNVTSGTTIWKQFEFDLIVPQAVRAGGQGVVTVTYKNISDTDAIAPLLWLDASRMATLREIARNMHECYGSGCSSSWGLDSFTTHLYSTGVMLGINREGPAGFIPPGASGSISFVMKPTVTTGEINFTLNTFKNMPMNWDTIHTFMKPSFVDGYAWDAVFANMLTSVGSTTQEYNAALAADATYLSRLGIYESDPNVLFTFELMKAGLATLVPRFTLGAFGLGASHAFDIWGNTGDDNLVLHYPVGKIRMFVPDPDTPNRFIGSKGDFGTLTVNTNDHSWMLSEKNGTLYHFKVDPNNLNNNVLDYLQDLNGNRVTINYTGSLVTSVTSSTGDTQQFNYNDQGRIIQSTDAVGRVTTYSYDQSGLHLLTITDAGGTTSYTYTDGYADAQSHAVKSVTYPAGTHLYYEYDTMGRMTKRYRDDNAETMSYAYDSSGEVTVTDALGNSTHILPTTYSQPGQIIDPIGAITRFSYDQAQNLIGITAPQGASLSLGYDAQSNLNSTTDPLGNHQSFHFGDYETLQSLTDSLGNALKYGYDSLYNNTKITYPDSSAEQGVYDSHGNLVQWTNRRGRSVIYTYDSKNLLTQKAYTDGSHVDYAYDSHRNLYSLTNSVGTTSFTYDNADRLTSITYPNGRALQYVYDSGSRKISMSDQSGFSVKYVYDSAGRLSQLLDGSNAVIATYTYDSAGRIDRKTMGNATYTTYAYDPAGKLLQLANYAANNSVISSYSYTYDLLGQKTGMTAPDGVYAYSYDAAGQLTSVALPGGGTIQYSYDAAGNRTTSVTSGITTTYITNGLNEYSAVGGMAFTYDADGNLASKSGGGTWSYLYDDENRLVSMTGTGGTWAYEYDSLGNRVAQTHNGQRTEYLIDPTGLGNIIAEFNGAGTLLTHYTYGHDLTSIVPTGSAASYYHFDGSGNTTLITGTAGNVLNSYSFLPFGEKVSSSETVTNPFTFVGQFGVRDEGNSLYFMRNRWYDPHTGRFTSPDPLGIGGGDSNLYRYVSNAVPNLVDPIGLAPGGEYNPLNNIPGGSDSVSRYGSNKDLLINGKQNARSTYDPINAISTKGGNLPDYYHGDTNGGKITNTLKDVVKNETDSPTWKTLENVQKFGIDVYKAPSWTQRNNLAVRAINKTTDKISKTLNDGLGDGFYYYYWLGSKLPNVPSLWSPQKQKPTVIPNSSDPNLKTTVGYGTQGYVSGDTPISYMIEFENMASATAPAQKVVVTDQLSANLDWSTFQLTQIVLNNTTISIPAGLQSYTTRTSVATDPNPVNVTIALNPATGLVSAAMESVDPVTGGVPEDPYAGFLPPNNATHRGEGHISFTIKPKAGLANGTVITNASTIVFDINAPITTNTVTNTIDSVRPTSRVNFIPSNTVTDSFTVPWGGSENSGSGIAYYDVYVSTDGGQAALWLPGSSLTSALFSGLAGHEYSFYTLAVDNAGNYQTAPATSQVVITGNLPLVQVDGGATPYRSILSAIGGTGNDSVIKARNAGFSENLLFNSPNSLTLSGGYGGNFTAVVGFTCVQGTLTVTSGALKIGNIQQCPVKDLHVKAVLAQS